MKKVSLDKSLNQLRQEDPFWAEKIAAYTSVEKANRILKHFMNIKLSTIKKVPLDFVTSFIDDFIHFIESDTDLVLAQDERSIMLWDRPPYYTGSGKKPYIIPFLLDSEAPVVIIVPGGAYTGVAMDHEGLQIAEALNKEGFHAVVLNYRVSPARFPAPQLDLIRTIQYVRSKAKEWKIIPDKLTLMGFSAGGHLCSSVAGIYDELAWQTGDLRHIDAKPNALILGYPQINLLFKVYGFSSGVFLLGSEKDDSVFEKLSSHNMITPDYPPTFVWSNEHDPLVKITENCILLARELEKARVPSELHIYDGNLHGVGLAHGSPAEVWLGQSVKFVKTQLNIK